jgi:CRP/FNR family transcriptional regulator, cyclic AMP receptor protein
MRNRPLFSTSDAPVHVDTDEIVARLRDLGSFAGAADADLRRIAQAGRRVNIPQGWSLIWEKTPADKAYVVLAGDVDVRRDGALVARLGDGDVIGEVALVQHRLRTATVVAATPLDVLHLGRDEVEVLYAEVPAFRAALDAAVSAHVV